MKFGGLHSKCGNVTGEGNVWHHHRNKNPPSRRWITTECENEELMNRFNGCERDKKMKGLHSGERQRDKTGGSLVVILRWRD